MPVTGGNYHLGDFKGLAILHHDWHQTLDGFDKDDLRARTFQLTPEGLLESARMLGFDLAPRDGLAKQGTLRALWLAAEFTRAPLPAFWSATAMDDGSTMYTHAEGTELSETHVHPLQHVYAEVSARFMKVVKHGHAKANLKPAVTWFLFDIDGKPTFCRLQTKPRTDYDESPRLAHLRASFQPGIPYEKNTKSSYSFAPAPFQEPCGQRLTEHARNGELELHAYCPTLRSL